MGKKIAIIVQRYGVEVNGGAEYHARILAEKLNTKHHVTVLTTTALDYQKWENHYPEGPTEVNGIKVLRFSTISIRSRKTRVARRAILRKKKYFRILKFLKVFSFFQNKFNITNISKTHINDWIDGQGPYCPELLEFIKTNKNKYDVFIFFTYLYFPTVKGMPIVPEKSVFIPTAHDEPLLYAKPYEKLFNIPKFIMYNTDSEKRLVEKNFKNYTKASDVAGVGIENYEGKLEALPEYLNEKKYFAYIGRIDTAKGCDYMLKYFIGFQKKYTAYRDYKLVLIGKNSMQSKYSHPNIIYTGFVSEQLKYTILKNAIAMIMPSFYESLSLVTLEAMNEKIPVIVNKKCDVLYQHILKSETGSAYDSQKSFSASLLKQINMTLGELHEQGLKAKRYVTENYSWEKVLEKFEKSFIYVTNS